MIIVTGHLVVAPEARSGYLDGCTGVVRQARASPGCLEFAISADLLDPTRIVILERWETTAAVEAFRGSGPSGAQQGAVLDASVTQYDVASARLLT